MIKYNLKCECGQNFESWFASSNEYEKLEKKDCLTAFVENLTMFRKLLCPHKLDQKRKR